MSAPPFTIRPFEPRDEDALHALAPRFLAGTAPWFKPGAFLEAVRKWTEGSIATIGPTRAIFVAEGEHGQCAGFVSVARQVHFTGLEQAYVGELVVSEESAGKGVGRALLTVAETWATDNGFGYLALDTGADNANARGFYAHMGFAEESVRLVKVLRRPEADDAG